MMAMLERVEVLPSRGGRFCSNGFLRAAEGPSNRTSPVPLEVHCARTGGDGLAGSILLLGSFGDHGLCRDQKTGN